MRNNCAVGAYESDPAKIVRRLLADGWASVGGTKHEKFEKPGQPAQFILLPRHRTISIGVARSIAVAAGWKRYN